MAEEDTYINEAYEVLQKLSADERKRLEYEARQKAILDYNSQMSSSREEGIQIGEARGEARGEEKERKRLSSLYMYLQKDDRIGEFERAVSDESYMEKLYKEYGL